MGSFCSGHRKVQKITERHSTINCSPNTNTSLALVYKSFTKIAKGSFGVVHKAESLLNEEHKVAIKSMSKKSLKVSVEKVKLEIDTLLTLDHPNIIKCYETFEDPMNFHIVMELCTGGELFDIIPANSHMEESEALLYTRSMLMAVNHLHQVGIVHRDLKPENFLFSKSKSPGNLKLVDFGLSNKFTNKFEKLHSSVGTPYYIAPEVLDEEYGFKCDLWSIGVILYIMISGDIPFYSNNMSNLLNKIHIGAYNMSKNPIWNEINEETKHLVTRMLCINADDRLSAMEALMHPAIFNIPKLLDIKYNILDKLKKYTELSFIQKCAKIALVRFLDFNEDSWEKKVFTEYDRHLTGVISALEICDSLEELSLMVHQNEIQELMRHAGIRVEGKMYYGEFIACLLEVNETLESKYKKLAFDFFDRDRKGFFTISDLEKALNFLGNWVEVGELEAEWKAKCSCIGLITLEEFSKLLY